MSNVVRESAAAYGERRRMTVREYYLAAEKGVFRDDERLELIDGEVLQLSPQKSPHSLAISNIDDALERAFGKGFYIRWQMPMRLDDFNEPEPDVVVAEGPRAKYVDHHPGPGDVVLVVEVSDTTLRKDRGMKAELYARFGIPEYWILDLNSSRLEVYREPRVDEKGRGSYGTSEVFAKDGSVSPLRARGAAIEVDELLPG